MYFNPKAGKKMAHTKKSALTIAVTLVLLTVILASSVYAQSEQGVLIASAKDTPNVLTLSGSGFDASATANIGLYLPDQTTLAFSFSDVTTDSQGNFAVNITLPTVSTSGFYLFIANTTNVKGFQPWVLYSPSDASGPSINVPEIVKVSPDDSNIFNVTGQGFDASKPVTLKLAPPHGPAVYIFPDNITTDGHGRFSAIIIVPTRINGAFNLAASTANGNANVTVTIPDLHGPPGATGQTGSTGATGATGASGENGTTGPTTSDILVYVSIVLSIVAIIIGIYAATKKRPEKPL